MLARTQKKGGALCLSTKPYSTTRNTVALTVGRKPSMPVVEIMVTTTGRKETGFIAQIAAKLPPRAQFTIMKTTVDLNEELAKDLQELADDEHVSLSDLVEVLLSASLVQQHTLFSLLANKHKY